MARPDRKLIFLAKPPDAPPDSPAFDAFVGEFHWQLVTFYLTLDTFQRCALCGHEWTSVDDWLAREPVNWQHADGRAGVACGACAERAVDGAPNE